MRELFPFFKNNPEITYLDSAATSQTLYTVVEDLNDFMVNRKSNAHRSGHSMGTWVDTKYYQAKEKIAEWLGISGPQDRIVFTSGASQGLIDAVAMCGKQYPGGNIYLGIDAHHSLLLPLQNLAKDNPWWQIIYIGLDENGRLNLDDLEDKISQDAGFKIIAATAVSNVLGMVNDLERIKDIAHRNKATTIIDASQIISKRNINCNGFDFVAWSWHKVYGPMGLGCLVIDPIWLEFDPIRPGGGTVSRVTMEKVDWLSTASRFESGTQNLAAIVTLPRLVDWLDENAQDLERHDKSLASFAYSHVPLKDFSPASQPESGLLSLLPLTGSTEDYTMLLDAKNIMVRGGKLCAQPLIDQITQDKSLLRLSWGPYTSTREIEIFFDRIMEIHGRFQKFIQ